MNGMPFARRMTLQQAEGEAAAGTTYTAVDYGLLALGVAGIGYTISEVINQTDTPDAAGTPSPTPATPTPSPTPAPGGLPIPAPSGGGLPVPAPSGGGLPVPAPFAGSNGYFEERDVTPEYQQWLDAGTGGMGDLVLIVK